MKRRNNLETAVKGLLIAVAVIIALVLSALALYMSNRARTTANDAATQYTDMIAEYNQIEVTQFDGMNVSGSQVVEVIRKSVTRDATYAVKVIPSISGGEQIYGADGKVSDDITLTKTTYYTYSASDTNGYCPTQQEDSYINPSATFHGEVHRNSNGMVDLITFTQQQ